MLARPETARLLASALLRRWLSSRVILAGIAVEVTVALVAMVVLHAATTGLALLALVVLTPVLLALSGWRSTRAMAPAGFTLGLGLGPQHLAVRHAVATTVLPYSAWRAAIPVGDVVLLQTRRGGVVPLPLELFGADLDRVQALVGAPVDASAPPPGPPLPYVFVCTPKTRGQMFRAELRQYARRPAVVAAGVLFALALLATLLSRRAPTLVSLLAVGLLLALTALNLWTTWRKLATCSMPGMTVRAGLLDDALVIEDATGRATVPFRGVDPGRPHAGRRAHPVEVALDHRLSKGPPAGGGAGPGQGCRRLVPISQMKGHR